MQSPRFSAGTRVATALLLAGLASIGLAAAMRSGYAIDPQRAPTTPSMPAQGSAALAPIDPQKWQDQQDMTWADYHPIPGVDWADPSRAPGRALRVALIAIDFPDQPFVVTLPKTSDLFGNPQVDPVRREDVPRFYADFFGKPGPFNHGHTINGFWMEQTDGQVGIPKIDAFGPYRMPRNLFEYGLNEYKQQSGCPTGFTCDGRMEPDADALWHIAEGDTTAEDVAEYLAEGLKKCVELCCPNLLIEENLKGPSLGIFAVYEIVTKICLQAAAVVRQVAYVDISPEHKLEVNQFAETTAVNRGINVKLFKTVPEAENWISKAIPLQQDALMKSQKPAARRDRA